MCDYFIGHPTEYARKKCSATKEHQEFQQAMKDLNAMVGLQSIKNGLNRTMSQVRFNQLRKLEGLPVDFEAPHHMIFVGNPGTGKTTVARMIGQIYKSLGLLSDGEVISADRSSLVGEYIGETERKMRGLIEEARGKVLFIDEAYSLCDSLSDRRDYGSRVIETLLPVLAEPDPDMVVILAGYEEEMERLMQHNQGLESRFAYKYHFEDYTAKELFEIAQKELDKQYYQLTEQAGETLLSVCEDRVKNKTRTFANARWIKQVIYNGILPALSKRVMESEGPHDFGKLVTIEVEDVNAAAGMFGKKTSRRRIGF